MEENETLDKIYSMLNGVGFKILKEHEIIFNPPSDKIDFLKNELVYLGYDDARFIVNKQKNKIFFKRSRFGNIEKDWLIGEYFIPFIIQYLKTVFPKEVRQYKIKKLLK